MPFLDIYLTSVVIDDFHIYRTLNRSIQNKLCIDH